MRRLRRLDRPISPVHKSSLAREPGAHFLRLDRPPRSPGAPASAEAHPGQFFRSLRCLLQGGDGSVSTCAGLAAATHPFIWLCGKSRRHLLDVGTHIPAVAYVQRDRGPYCRASSSAVRDMQYTTQRNFLSKRHLALSALMAAVLA